MTVSGAVEPPAQRPGADGLGAERGELDDIVLVQRCEGIGDELLNVFSLLLRPTPRYAGRVSARINHGSAYGHEPAAAAAHLAALTGGVAAPFHPCEGAWVCFLSGKDEDWEGPLVEIYPRNVTLAADGEGTVSFAKMTSPARGGGAHFNLTIHRSRTELERICERRALRHAWREWAGLLDVWLDDELLIECVPAR